MKKKWKIPILLLAAVIMLSIFYIMDGVKKKDAIVKSDNYTVSDLNPEFTEARLIRMDEALKELEKLESDLASGNLNEEETAECIKKKDEIVSDKALEIDIEEAIMAKYGIQDCYVVLNKEEKLIEVSVYQPVEVIDFNDMINNTELYLFILNSFDLNYKIQLNKDFD